MTRMVKKSAAPIYLVALVWLVWGFLLPLYRPVHFVLAAVASILVFGVGKVLFPDQPFQTQEPKPAPKVKPAQDEHPEIEALAAERDRALGEMRRLNDSIKDPGISAQIDQLESATQKIIDLVVETPEKLPQIRKFLNYYLPTTLKLLNAYDRMDDAGISGTNIDGTKGKIENMMDMIVTAFHKQLDALFGDEALDISTDITVMEQMLIREGIGGTQMTTEQ